MIDQTPKTEQETRDLHRIIFYALLEQASRYREGFWREDCDLYEKGLMEAFEVINKNEKFSFKYKQKHLAQVRNMANTHRLENIKFNKMLEETVKNLESKLSADSKVRFDNYSTAYGLVADELAKANNTTEFITVCKLYNEGYLDYRFEIENDPEQARDDIIHHDNSHLRTQKP